MSGGTDNLIGRKEPWDNTGKKAHDTKEEKHAHDLASSKCLVGYLLEDVDEHPQGDDHAKDGDRDHDQGPSPAYE